MFSAVRDAVLKIANGQNGSGRRAPHHVAEARESEGRSQYLTKNNDLI